MNSINKDENSPLSNPIQFEKLFKEWYKPLCRTAYKIVGDKVATEDIVQDIFVKLWNQRDSLTFSFSPKAYLYKAVINASINYVEKNKKLYRPEPDQWEHLKIENSQAEEIINYKETEKTVNEALDTLPPSCKNIFLLSRHEGLTNKEIAETLDISIKTVENQMTKALKTLKEKLGPLLKNIISLLLFSSII